MIGPDHIKQTETRVSSKTQSSTDQKSIKLKLEVPPNSVLAAIHRVLRKLLLHPKLDFKFKYKYNHPNPPLLEFAPTFKHDVPIYSTSALV